MSTDNTENDDLDIDTENEDIADEDELDESTDDSTDDEDESEEDESDAQEDEEEEDETVSISKSELEKLKSRAGQSAVKERLAKKGKAPAENGPSEATLARLEARGILDPEDQRTVLSVMKRAGLSLHDAVNDDYVKSTLERSAKRRKVGKAIATTNSGSKGSSTTRDAAYYVSRNLVPDPKNKKLFAEYQDKLAELSARNS